jgi:hypothetical protein
MSVISPDENKVFGVTFRTPPADSTGIPHILEHSVMRVEKIPSEGAVRRPSQGISSEFSERLHVPG